MVEGAVSARLEEIERRLKDAESRIDALIARAVSHVETPAPAAAPAEE